MKLRSFWHFGRVTVLVSDFVLLWSATICAFKLSPRYSGDILVGPWLNKDLQLVGYGLPLFMALGLQVTSTRKSHTGFRPSEALAQTLAGLSGGMLAFFVLHAVIEFSLIGRYVLILGLGYGTAFIVGSRMLVGKLAEHQKRKLLVYGGKDIADELTAQVEAQRLPVRIVGQTDLGRVFPMEPAKFHEMQYPGLYAYCTSAGAEGIVVEMSDALSPVEREALLFCTGMGVNVIELGYFYEREFEKVHVAGLRESWFWTYEPSHVQPVFFATKRTIDILSSLLAIVAFAPLAPLVALIIKLQDGGSVLYSQIRVGLNNQPFQIYKFRTMRVGAEKTGAQWAKKGDDRATWFGRVMRKTRIDEVPQFWNILTGEMSFIGPRPERPEFVEAIEKEFPFYRYRHLIKPGLTGWAQINYPYGASIDDAGKKLAYDLYYLKYSTLTRELHIILRTMVAMVRGAR